jgi:hypothetical protein
VHGPALHSASTERPFIRTIRLADIGIFDAADRIRLTLGIGIFADVIVRILYGQQFAASALLLQVLIWTQVLVATDAMLKQTMIANGREYAVVTRALAGVATYLLAALTLGLLPRAERTFLRDALRHGLGRAVP